MILGFLFVIFGAALFPQSSKPDFSGTWQPDQARTAVKTTPKNAGAGSEGGAPPPPPPNTQPPPEVIQHKEPKFNITRSTPDGEDYTTLSLTTDGAQNTNSVGEGEFTHKSKTHWEGSNLVTDWRLERYGTVLLQGHDVRSLSEDGKTMVFDRRLESPAAVSEIHTVMTRKK